MHFRSSSKTFFFKSPNQVIILSPCSHPHYCWHPVPPLHLPPYFPSLLSYSYSPTAFTFPNVPGWCRWEGGRRASIGWVNPPTIAIMAVVPYWTSLKWLWRPSCLINALGELWFKRFMWVGASKLLLPGLESSKKQWASLPTMNCLQAQHRRAKIVPNYCHTILKIW